MSKLDELIKQYCPDGVKFVKLGEVCKTKTSPCKLKTQDYQSEGQYLIIDQGQSMYAGFTDNEDALLPEGEYILYGDHTCIVKYHNGSFAQGADGLKILTTDYNTKYVYYALCNFNLVNTEYKRHWSQAKEIEIPLPPLAIQSRIVEILDNFSSLTAELQAELQARRSQYEYYRNHLLSFDGYDNIQNENNTTTNNSAAAQGKTVKWVKLGDVCDTVTDYTAAGSFADLAKNVIYNREPDFALLVRTTDIKSNFTKGDFVYINEHAFNYLWRVNLDKVSLVMPNVGNCGEVYYLTSEELPYEKCCLAPNALLLRSSSQNMKYLYHLLKTYDFQNRLKKIISPVGQTKFNKTELKQILIPLPSLSEQRRIADILDRFEALTTDLQCGLPAEIEARQQQYEYYRNKLLTFEPKK